MDFQWIVRFGWAVASLYAVFARSHLCAAIKYVKERRESPAEAFVNLDPQLASMSLQANISILERNLAAHGMQPSEPGRTGKKHGHGGIGGAIGSYSRARILSCRGPMRKQTSRSNHFALGFSMLELLIGIVIFLVITAMALIGLQRPLQNMRSDAAMRELLDQLRQAREYSIVNRRYVKVTFPTSSIGQPEIQITQMNTLTTTENAGSDVVISTIPLQQPLVFTLVTGMSDTPDGFGNAYSIEFEGLNGLPALGILFQSDGELVDGGTYLPISGTVFLGVAGNKSSARAITVLGTTGRVRGWRSDGIKWVQF